MRKARRGSRLAVSAGLSALLLVAAQAVNADGIKVHGHWTIDVRNTDGTLASRHEIENELVPSGTSALTGLLAGNYQTPTWRILLGSAADAGPCVRNTAPPSAGPLSSLVITPPDTLTNPLRIEDPDGFHEGHTESNHWTFTSGNQLAFQMLALANTSEVTSNIGPGQPPGFSIGTPIWHYTDFAIYADVPFTFNSSAAAPGTYTFPIWMTYNGFETPSPNIYTATINLLPPEPPDPGLSEPYACSAVAPGTVIPYEFGNAWFPTVGVTIVPVPPAQNLEISGNVTAAFANAITQVTSIVVFNNSLLEFSSRTLATPIQVAVGQRIYVKVAFSFS